MNISALIIYTKNLHIDNFFFSLYIYIVNKDDLHMNPTQQQQQTANILKIVTEYFKNTF